MTHIISQAKKKERLMKEYLLSDRYVYLKILMTGVMKPEFYIRKSFFNFLILDQVINV